MHQKHRKSLQSSTLRQIQGNDINKRKEKNKRGKKTKEKKKKKRKREKEKRKRIEPYGQHARSPSRQESEEWKKNSPQGKNNTRKVAWPSPAQKFTEVANRVLGERKEEEKSEDGSSHHAVVHHTSSSRHSMDAYPHGNFFFFSYILVQQQRLSNVFNLRNCAFEVEGLAQDNFEDLQDAISLVQF